MSPFMRRQTIALAQEHTYTVIDQVGMPHVLDFIQTKLSSFDTCALDWLKLLPLRKTVLLHGECTFPGSSATRQIAHGFRIRASVNVLMSPPYRYEHWARIPSPRHLRGWVSGEKTFKFQDLEECALHTLAHECFHFLSATGQVTWQDCEANANWWGDRWLSDYRSIVDRGGQLRLF